MACHACEIACKSANNVPEGVFWNRVLTDGGSGIETLAGEYPNGTISVMPVSCQHCENPACVKVCPMGATYKDPETGVVRQAVSYTHLDVYKRQGWVFRFAALS